MNRNTTEFVCPHCGAIYLDKSWHQAHLQRCLNRFLPEDNPFTEYTIGAFARALVYLASLKDPNKGVSEDIDDMVKAAYTFLGEECPHETLMITREQAMRRLDEWLDELDEQHGPPSDAAMAEAEAWLAGGEPIDD